MSDASQPTLPADVPPALRLAVAAALDWLRELDREAGAAGGAGASQAPPVRRPR